MRDRILITGGSGFIGTNLIGTLLSSNKDIEVLSIDIKEPKISEHRCLWKKVDICNLELLMSVLQKFRPTHVVHLAARTDLNGKSLDDYQANILGVSNLLKVLDQINTVKKALFASSMYVCYPGYIPKSFKDYSPHTVYGESKVLTEEIIAKENIKYNYSIMRPTSIWGPWFGEPYRIFFDIVLSRKYFHLGNKACNKTYGYIDNTVYQILELLKSSPDKSNGKTFYLGDLPQYNISEWAEEIAEYLNFKIYKMPFLFFKILAWLGDLLRVLNISFPMTSFRLKNMTTDNVHDLSLIKEIAPNLPVTRIEGVKKTIDWLKKQK